MKNRLSLTPLTHSVCLDMMLLRSFVCFWTTLTHFVVSKNKRIQLWFVFGEHSHALCLFMSSSAMRCIAIQQGRYLEILLFYYRVVVPACISLSGIIGQQKCGRMFLFSTHTMCFFISALQSNIVFVAWHIIACAVLYIFMCVMVSVVYDEFVCHCRCIQSSVFAYHSMCCVICLCLCVVMVSVV